jgi:hypothetical protein
MQVGRKSRPIRNFTGKCGSGVTADQEQQAHLDRGKQPPCFDTLNDTLKSNTFRHKKFINRPVG